MNKKFIRHVIYYEDYYLNFFNAQKEEVRKKLNWTLQLISIQERIPEKFFKHITGSDALFEIRVEVGSDIFRVFSFFDKGNLVVLVNGFQKKTQKTPKSEIKMAEKLKKEYLEPNIIDNNMNIEDKKITTFESHLDSQYGKIGTNARDIYEEEFESFQLGILIQEMRKERGMTQEQLALKCGTTKNYISKIENNASDIRLSTLMRIIRQGLGGHLKLSLTA
jgi:phage-related protein/DNA-binding XRE family transcriptional regulator